MGFIEDMHWEIHFSPLIDIYLLAIITFAVLLVWGYLTYQIRARAFWRLPFLVLLLSVLANPTLLEEEREPLESNIIVIIDTSQSQKSGSREEQTEQALSWLEEQIEHLKNVSLNTIHLGQSDVMRETKLFASLTKAINDLPANQLAGAFLITDGQVHDIPKKLPKAFNDIPIHALITGERSEQDRNLKIIKAPTYGIVGQSIDITLHVEDASNSKPVLPKDVTVSLVSDTENYSFDVTTGKDFDVTLPINHAGQNVYMFNVEPLNNEISQTNNRQAIVINGVRDRLKVLLVSGRPHAGGRMWRNILTSDPSVDLVHFTILRDPSKQDATPEQELALIAFPIRELFDVKLNDFDLVIFDRFSRTNILPAHYFTNIANYVENGGAFLEASGPGYASQFSIYNTALRNILPASPTNSIFEEKYTPQINTFGKAHPVTQNLGRFTNSDGTSNWAPWYRQVGITPDKGQILMTGVNDTPLMILDRVNDGRVAQFSSDHLWLWARGFQNGGPQIELLRRTIHWLMKEPDLEENALHLTHSNGQILVRKRHIDNNVSNIAVTKPDGTIEEFEINALPGQFGEYILKANQLGVYSFEDGTQSRHIIIGDINPPELQDLISTHKKLDPVLRQTSSATTRWEEMSDYKLRRIASGNRMKGYNWLGITKEEAYQVISSKSTPLLPAWAIVSALITLLALGWWRESKN